jgi:hypothetical protein
MGEMAYSADRGWVEIANDEGLLVSRLNGENLVVVEMHFGSERAWMAPGARG